WVGVPSPPLSLLASPGRSALLGEAARCPPPRLPRPRARARAARLALLCGSSWGPGGSMLSPEEGKIPAPPPSPSFPTASTSYTRRSGGEISDEADLRPPRCRLKRAVAPLLMGNKQPRKLTRHQQHTTAPNHK
ncbi:unnamed protein product, partial [Prorocentrum cordatum]